MNIPFNKPYLTGNEIDYITSAVNSGKISGNGFYTKKCQDYFTRRYGFKKVLLTSSCTDALEMCAILADLAPGDEVIMPSFTFVSTANAFVLRGARIIFADSCPDNPNIDTSLIEELITPKTKIIVLVHYAGLACNMERINEIALNNNLIIVEDAAQAIDSFFLTKPLGSLGHFSAFSFHETKNIISGEGGMLVINDEKFFRRAEIIWEKGTNRAAFYRGEVNKYGWVDIGSSFLPSEITAAFLFAQLENLDLIQARRKKIWNLYYNGLQPLQNEGFLKLPFIPENTTNNAHILYILCSSFDERTNLINHLKKNGILAVFHYISLHSSPFYADKHDGRRLQWSDYYTDHLLRLPLFYELKDDEVNFIIEKIIEFYKR